MARPDTQSDEAPMAAVGWFYAKGSRQYGPVSMTELRQLADRGEVTGDDLVWREGMKDWSLARKVKGLFDDGPIAKTPEGAVTVAAEPPRAKSQDSGLKTVETATAGSAARPVLSRGTQGTFEQSAAAYERSREGDRFRLFDHLLETVRKRFTRRFVESAAWMFAVAGHYGLYAAMAAILVVQLTLAGKDGGIAPAVLGVIAVVALSLLQYAAGRFSATLDRLNRATSGRVSSTALLDCFALLGLVGGLGLLIGLTLLGVRSGSLSLIFPAVAGFIVCEFLAMVALNPETINLTVDPETRVADEALGGLTFLAKLAIHAAPVGFGVGVVWATLRLVWAEASMFLPPPNSESVATNTAVPEMLAGLLASDSKLLEAQATALSAVELLFFSAALPFATYLVFLASSLIIDAFRSLLGLNAGPRNATGDKPDIEA